MEKAKTTLALMPDKEQGFINLIVGKPGSGKTTIIKKMIKEDFKGKYSYILLVSPSSVEYKDILPDKQATPTFDIEWIYKQINLCNLAMQMKESKVLIILDDCIADIKENQKKPKLIALFFNRRHLLWNGNISLIVTTQKYTMMPARFRSCATDIIFFNLSPFDVKKIFEESVLKYTKHQWEELVARIFDKPHTNIYFDIDSQIIN